MSVASRWLIACFSAGLALPLAILVGGYFLLGEDTIYADSFSEGSFSTIELGLSAEAVETILGRPLEIVERSDGRFVRRRSGSESGDAEIELLSEDSKLIDEYDWVYSKPGARSDSYYVRIVTFSRNDVVIRKHESFHSD